MNTNQQFDEIRVYEGIAERTGKTVDRAAIRTSPATCRTLAELSRSIRRLGDGLFYLPVSMWPPDVTQLSLAHKWTTMS